jgi:hypothetical protein
MWKIENRIGIRNLKRQLNQVIEHEQVENDVVVNNNLSVNKTD